MKILGSYEELRSNLSSEETEENDEAKVESTKSDSETSGKKLWGKHFHTQFNVSTRSIIVQNVMIFILFTTELLQLPDGWREARTLEGQVIYIDDRTMKFQMMRPKNGKFL